MPRVLPIDSMTNKRICKNAGSGGFLGSSVTNACHNKARIGLMGQCFKCSLPFQRPGHPTYIRMIGCAGKSGYKCGPQEK